MMMKTQPKKQGRNELCACGSGVKYKNCCGKIAEPAMRDVLKCLYLILDRINKTSIAFKKGLPVEFPKVMLDRVPDNFIEKMICTNQQGKLTLFVEHERPIIEIPTEKQTTKITKTRL